MSDVEDGKMAAQDLRFRDRPSETVQLRIPVEAMTRVRELAAAHDMPAEALLKMYIGNGLRPDKVEPSERFLATIAYVLARHIASQEERTAILRDVVEVTSGPVYVTGE